MARTLKELQKQYNSKSKIESLRGGPGPGGRGLRRPGGKPKDMKNTVKRLFHYIGRYKIRFVFVFISMIITTASSLLGGYMISPIINRVYSYLLNDVVGYKAALDKLGIAVEDVEQRGIGKAVHGFIEWVLDMPMFNGVSGDKFAEFIAYIVVAVIILASVYVISAFGTYVQARIMLSISQNAVKAIRNDLFEKLQKLPVRFYDSHPTGEIMSRFTNDVDNIDVMLNNSLTMVVSGIISLVGTFLFMITTNVWLTLITVAFIPLLITFSTLIGKRSGKYYSGQQAALGAVNGYIEETVSGQKVVKVFNHENDCEEEFELINEDLRDKQQNAQFWGGVMGPIMHNTSMICYVVTLCVGGLLLVGGRIDIGNLTVFANYSKQFSMPINQLSMQVSTLFAALAGAERVFKVMDADPESPDSIDAIYDEIVGDVVFENVSFGYVPEKTVLKNISLYAHPGQKIAFVGSTGAGKTTITNLLNRFYDINEGEILIDGKPIKSFSREHLRKNIAMVLQDTHLFTGTVMENIRYGRLDATDDEVIAAAKTASAHSFIMRLEHGYDTVLEGDGANLSQGQRQLLNIARAALSKAPILVLDEATSSVDTRTERHIEHGMDRLMKNRTTFVIAHRLSTVRNANAIMVLENGEIIERGDHEDLLKMKGRYYELYTGKRELA